MTFKPRNPMSKFGHGNGNAPKSWEALYDNFEVKKAFKI